MIIYTNNRNEFIRANESSVGVVTGRANHGSVRSTISKIHHPNLKLE